MLNPSKFSNISTKHKKICVQKTKQDKNLLRKNYIKNVDIKVQCKRLPSLLAKNNHRRFDIPLKSINQFHRHFWVFLFFLVCKIRFLKKKEKRKKAGPRRDTVGMVACLSIQHKMCETLF